MQTIVVHGVSAYPVTTGKIVKTNWLMAELFKEKEMDGHEKFMSHALAEARQALLNNEFPVGCVIVSEGKIIASGGRRNSAAEMNELDHAEIVALRNLQQSQPGLDLSGVTVYSTMEPCLMCYSTMIVNGVRSVVYAYEDVMGGGTNLPLKLLSPLYSSLEISIVPKVMRFESLRLFQQFFGSNNNDYLKDTLLAKYTLEQPLVSV
ncbi:nucleoside deaminase [Desulfosediminicola ganghwensis]|uniref:nucleoside deaminase n=1 Tax=Desulfosediminicola ganghwensis TaxID=2569540 RepID=UPI0023DD7FCE|nr:nucleoside deaminase [Desulfosediminicola ganghwensis]